MRFGFKSGSSQHLLLSDTGIPLHSQAVGKQQVRSLSSSHINKLSQTWCHQGYQTFYICSYLGIKTSHKAASLGALGFRVCFCRLLLPVQLMSQMVWLRAMRVGRSVLQQHPAASPVWQRVGNTGSHVSPKHHERSCWESMKSRNSTFWDCS